jgi:LAO/AO transport system kinase
VMLDMQKEKKWRPPVIATVSTRNEGITELWSALLEHRIYMEKSGQLTEMRHLRVGRELTEQVEYLVKKEIWDQVKDRIALDDLIERITNREQDPYSAAFNLLRKISFINGSGREGA